MIDLKNLSGLPFFLNEDTLTLFSSEMDLPPPAFRRLKEMETLWISDIKELIHNKDEILYAMYRNVSLAQHQELIRKFNLRFDVTIIPPGRIGKEAVKTAGHYHPIKAGTQLSYPEVYEVLYGKAYYLLQKTDNADYSKILDVLVIEAEPGQKVIIPPNYGHITINASPKPLVMTNWVEHAFASIYQPIIQYGGGTYFAVFEKGDLQWFPNPKYQAVPPIKYARPKPVPEFGLEFGKPMYLSGIATPKKLRFLTHPEEVNWHNKHLFEKIQ